MKQITFTIPASSANLGPGFDCVGIALSLHNHFTFIQTESGYRFSCENPKKFDLDSSFYEPEQNMALCAYLATCKKHGWVERFFHLIAKVNIPPEGGLGSSGTAILAGVCAAYAFADKQLDRNALLDDAYDIEQHPDNIGASLFGGFTCAFRAEKSCFLLRQDLPMSLGFYVMMPKQRTNTEQNRITLPAKLERSDVVFNLSRLSTLVAAIYQQRYDVLFEAMQDKVHEPYRINPAFACPVLKQKLVAHGLYGWSLSGSGPAMLLVCAKQDQAIERCIDEHFEASPFEVELFVMAVDNRGLFYQ